MAKRSKIATRGKTTPPKAKAAARRRLAARKPPLRSKLKVGVSAEKSAPEKPAAGKNAGGALAALTALLASLPSLAIDAAAPAVRKTEQAIGQIDIAKFIGALTAAMPDDPRSGQKKSAKRQIAEEAAVLAAAVALIALRRKLPLMKIVGSGVPGNILMLLKALSTLRR
jgi:hypothetical protein